MHQYIDVVMCIDQYNVHKDFKMPSFVGNDMRKALCHYGNMLDLDFITAFGHWHTWQMPNSFKQWCIVVLWYFWHDALILLYLVSSHLYSTILNFKSGVGIATKSKETSTHLANITLTHQSVLPIDTTCVWSNTNATG